LSAQVLGVALILTASGFAPRLPAPILGAISQLHLTAPTEVDFRAPIKALKVQTASASSNSRIAALIAAPVAEAAWRWQLRSRLIITLHDMPASKATPCSSSSPAQL
jgi:hypothetical protein